MYNKESAENINYNFFAFYSPTEKKFFCSESGNKPMNCSRDWVDTWEMFNIEEVNGKCFLRSMKPENKYVVVSRDDHKLYCTAVEPVTEAEFKIDYKKGTIKAYNNMYLRVGKDGGDITADALQPVSYELFQIKTVSLGDSEGTRFAHPDKLHGQPRLTMNSTKTQEFRLLKDLQEDTYFLETVNYEFVYPDSTKDSLTYKKTAINHADFVYEIKPLTSDTNAGLVTIYSKQWNQYIRMCNSSDGWILLADADDTEAEETHFLIKGF